MFLESQIQSARTILLSLLNTHGRSLNYELLITLLAETDTVLNSRPLGVDTLGDVKSKQPLCLSNILTMKSKVVLLPPGQFLKADKFSRRWRCIHTLQQNSGFNGARNFCGVFRPIQNGTTNVEIYRRVTLCSVANGKSNWSKCR